MCAVKPLSFLVRLEAFETERRQANERRTRAEIAQKQIAEAEAWAAKKAERPTIDELREKHGPNWGMKGADAEDDETMRRRQVEQMERGRAFFERECVRGGLSKDSPISPTLERIINEWRERGGNAIQPCS